VDDSVVTSPVRRRVKDVRTREEPAVNDPQTWTLIAGFFALMVTMIGLTLRTVRAELGSVRSDLGAELRGLRGDMDGRFNTVDARLEHLDRDVQAVVTRLMEP
jgi:hypothetical protein